ncbi:hypothetical protein [Brevundimonas sp. UBA7664]|uniref:hypothetical protein n=1 Tax=Brevundimonas sp. UBA7664 TaxID=1946141 RepID=UPI0025C30317|nr:hypothetical protein [Brevundimonas sp. UBA7664]
MTQHNIIGRERGGAHVLVSTIRRRRRSHVVEVILFHLKIGAIGIPAGLFDMWLGQPIALGVVVGVLVAWQFWPSRK